MLFRTVFQPLVYAAYGKIHHSLKQISIDGDGKLRMHQLTQALCNGESKPASLRIAGDISAYEAFLQLIRRNIQRFTGNIAEADQQSAADDRCSHIYTGSGHGIFTDISQEIIKHAP